MARDSLQARWNVASPDVSLEQFDGEYVALDMALGRYFALSPAASVVLDALLAGVTPETIINLNGERRDELSALFLSLEEMRLLAAGHEDPAEPVGAMRDLIATLSGPISIESHDDLADLILADPIHDTDEDFGWPVRKAND